MKPSSLVLRFALASMLFAAPATLHAQKPAPPRTAPSAADIAKLTQLPNASALAQSATSSQDGEAPLPLQIVVQFLQLQPSQQQAFGQLLAARQAVIPPLVAQIQQGQQQLAALLASGANPAVIGTLVIQLTALQQQVAGHQQDFLTHFVAILDPGQQQLFQAVQIAAQLQPALPAFQMVGLI